MLARTAAAVFSNKLNAEVKIKTFYIKPDLRIHAEEVQINDTKQNPMIYLGKLDAKLSLRDMANEMRVRSINIDDILVNLVKYQDEYKVNISELFSSDRERKKKDAPNMIYLDELNLTRGHFVFWNQNKDNPEKVGMDYAHLDIDSIYLSASKLSFNGDTIVGFIHDLRAEDKSGFVLSEFNSPSKFLVSSKGFDFKHLKIQTHATSLDLDLQFLYNKYSDYRKFVDSIYIIANIYPSQLTLSDLRYFSAVMGKMTDTLQIGGLINGYVRDFVAKDFSFSFKDSTDFHGTIKMRGLPKFSDTHIVGDVQKLTFTYQDISEFTIPSPTGKIPLPEILASVKSAVFSGNYNGFPNNFNTKFNLHTNIGNIYFEGALNNNINIVQKPKYFYTMHANNVNVKEMLGMKDDLMLTFSSEMSGEGLNKKDADMQMSFDVERMKLYGNEFDNVKLSCDVENQRIIANANVDSELLKLNLNGLLDISHKAL